MHPIVTDSDNMVKRVSPRCQLPLICSYEDIVGVRVVGLQPGNKGRYVLGVLKEVFDLKLFSFGMGRKDDNIYFLSIEFGLLQDFKD